MKHGPTDPQIEALADAMCQVLNELAEGNNVCDLVKARATIAMQPFLLDDNGDLPDLEWAHATIASSCAHVYQEHDVYGENCAECGAWRNPAKNAN
jgi:hypothetical protein